MKQIQSNNKWINHNKEDKGREIQTLRFLRCSANLAYIHASKLSELEDSTKQASKASKAYTWLPRCQ